MKLSPKTKLKCVVCNKRAIMKIWCYSGDEHPAFCSEQCFQKLCELLKEPYMIARYGKDWDRPHGQK